MKGQETAPINDTGMAYLLGFDEPMKVIIGKPKGKALKVKTFNKRVRKRAEQ